MSQQAHYIYFITTVSEKGGDHLKIGVTTDIDNRVKQIQTGCPLPIKVDCLIPASSKQHAYDLEAQLHSKFAEYMTCGEWFVKAKVYSNMSIQSVLKAAKKNNDKSFRRSRLVRSKDKQDELATKLKKANAKMKKHMESNAEFKRQVYKLLTGKDTTKSVAQNHLIDLLLAKLQ